MDGKELLDVLKGNEFLDAAEHNLKWLDDSISEFKESCKELSDELVEIKEFYKDFIRGESVYIVHTKSGDVQINA